MDREVAFAHPAASAGGGVVIATNGMPISLLAFTVTGARITAIDVIDDPGRLAAADLAVLGP